MKVNKLNNYYSTQLAIYQYNQSLIWYCHDFLAEQEM
jgi:hypothetical protein